MVGCKEAICDMTELGSHVEQAGDVFGFRHTIVTLLFDCETNSIDLASTEDRVSAELTCIYLAVKKIFHSYSSAKSVTFHFSFSLEFTNPQSASPNLKSWSGYHYIGLTSINLRPPPTSRRNFRPKAYLIRPAGFERSEIFCREQGKINEVSDRENRSNHLKSCSHIS
jgi:hypothetical protein